MSRDPQDADAPMLAQTLPDRSSGEVHLEPGAKIGRYVLDRRLGAGTMGVVWAAHDPQLDRSIAIKLVHPGLAASPDAATRLLREARAMAKLSHRAVITVHDAGDVDGQLFIAMELVDGSDLGSLLRARRADQVVDWSRWLAIMLEAGRGLEAAHRAGILHRDFKPDNVLVAASGRVCVGDFGLASLGERELAAAAIRRERTSSLQLTTTGALLGTPAYMSSQSLRGEPVDARADQFSFCVATWEALYGARPFVVETTGLEGISELNDQIEAGVLPPPPPGSSVPTAVRDILARGLHRDPEARWHDMGSLLDALARAGRNDEPPLDAPRRRRSVTWLAAIAGAVAVLGIVLGVVLAIGRREPARPSTRAPVAQRLFSTSLPTRFAVSSDGSRIAWSSDRIQVDDLRGTGVWSIPMPIRRGVIAYIDVDLDEVRFSLRSVDQRYRWRYASDGAVTTDLDELGGEWLGTSTRGEVVYDRDAGTLKIVEGGTEIARWSELVAIDHFTLSPDRRRIAYMVDTRFRSRLLVRDLERDTLLELTVPLSITALAWSDERTLLYATGNQEDPTIHRIAVGTKTLGEPVELYRVPRGWFSGIQVRGDRMWINQLQPSPRSRIVERAGTSATVLDGDRSAVALGWISSSELLSWSGSSQRIEFRDYMNVPRATKAMLDGEPANATIAGDLVIASLRRNAGRETTAVSFTTGQLQWSHRDLKTFAVRCAGDRRRPCYAIRTADREDELVTIEPTTGELGTQPLYRGPIEDVAVSADGARLALAVGNTVRELDAAGNVLAEHPTELSKIRTVAFDPRGGFLVGGAGHRNNYSVAQLVDGKLIPLANSDDELLFLVRPSEDGARVLYLARGYAPELWRVDL